MQFQKDLVAYPFLVEFFAVSEDIHTLINSQQSDSCTRSGRQLDFIWNTRMFLWRLIGGFVMELNLQRMASISLIERKENQFKH